MVLCALVPACDDHAGVIVVALACEGAAGGKDGDQGQDEDSTEPHKRASNEDYWVAHGPFPPDARRWQRHRLPYSIGAGPWLASTYLQALTPDGHATRPLQTESISRFGFAKWRS